jgi:hypothetical protein
LINPNIVYSSNECVGPGGLESSLQLPCWRSDLAVGQGELNLRVVELLGVLTLAQRDRDCGGLDDLNAREPNSVTRSHLVVHLLYCSVHCGITVLLVHIVIPSTTLITHPDTEVLDRGGVFLENLFTKVWNTLITKFTIQSLCPKGIYKRSITR